MSEARSSRSLQEIHEEFEPLRFQVGDNVTCKISRTLWEDGKITQLWWRHPKTYVYHPYQVEMRLNQRQIYVPIDNDDVIQKIERAWWEELRERKDLSDEEALELINELILGKNPDAPSHDGETALLYTLRCHWRNAVHALLGLSADPNCAGRNCARPLHVAIVGNTGADQADLTKALLEAKANPQLQDKDPYKDPDYDSKSFQERVWHRTALHYGAEQGGTEIVRLLLEARAELDVQDAQYKLPLHLAIENQRVDAVRLLIDSRADINTGHMEIGLATAPLIDAAHRDDQSLMHLLINAKANLDHRGKQDMTALHVAARSRRTCAAKMLIDARADTNLKAGGKSAAELAFKNGLSELAALLGYAGDNSGKRCEAAPPLIDTKTRAMLFTDEPVAKHRRACGQLGAEADPEAGCMCPQE